MPTPAKLYLSRTTEAAPLAVFRICFGIMMLVSLVRFWANGWIDKLYIKPVFFFSYYGFEWVKPLGPWTYLLFVICGLAAAGLALGYFYRFSAIIFFLSFTYIELMDKTTYLNHYYFISLVGFLLIFLPAEAYFSVDAARKGVSYSRIPAWAADSLRLMLGIVYLCAGLAKLNSDWLLHAMPLKIWLPARYYLPIVGQWLQLEWVHYAFSWGGMLYDLSIPFLLLWHRTRWLAYGLVVVFHLVTGALFPIGMFPYIMIVSALIFIDADFHHKILAFLSHLCGIAKERFDTGRIWPARRWSRLVPGLLVIFFAVQLLLPFRYLVYPGKLFWTEEGFRFSWRVMLMEKAGYTQMKVVDGQTGRQQMVDNAQFLTPFQEKQMAFQPDFILEYAHFIASHYLAQGVKDVKVYAESYVALNGRRSCQFIDPTVDLSKEKESFIHKSWISPFPK